MMMKLHEYTNEILDIAKANDKSFDIGADMFLANVRNAGVVGAPYYAGAIGVDYAALKPHLEELADSYPDFVSDFRANQTRIAALRREADVEAVKAVMCGE